MSADTGLKRWAFSGLAIRFKADGYRCINEVNHIACVIPARSRQEALGIALEMCRKAYPADAGWHGHTVAVHDCDKVVEPDQAWRATPIA